MDIKIIITKMVVKYRVRFCLCKLAKYVGQY